MTRLSHNGQTSRASLAASARLVPKQAWRAEGAEEDREEACLLLSFQSAFSASCKAHLLSSLIRKLPALGARKSEVLVEPLLPLLMVGAALDLKRSLPLSASSSPLFPLFSIVHFRTRGNRGIMAAVSMNIRRLL